MMEHNLAHIRSELIRSRLYGASSNFLVGLGWKRDPQLEVQFGGNYLVDKERWKLPYNRFYGLNFLCLYISYRSRQSRE